MGRLNLDHNTNELKRLIAENPDLPIVILANESSVCDNGAWTYCSLIKVELGELFDSDEYSDEWIINNRRDLEDYIGDRIYDNHPELTEEEYEKAVAAEMARLEPYWKKVIAIYATN